MYFLIRKKLLNLSKGNDHRTMDDILLLKHTLPTGAKREISKENMIVDIIP